MNCILIMSRSKHFFAYCLFILVVANSRAQDNSRKVPDSVMQQVYEQVKTPYKYGLILAPEDSTKRLDCPSVFRKNNKWFMTYIVFDGRGYETWLAQSNDLLHWKTAGRLLSFTDTTDWDSNQKAGYTALVDASFGGSYSLEKYAGNYWMSYLGGSASGYEAGDLAIGIAFTKKDPAIVHQWQRLSHPVLTIRDPDVRWWETKKLYKSTVILDKAKKTGYNFVMYYNAYSDSAKNDARKGWFERIGMAVSNDMKHWKRFEKEPVVQHPIGITGDPYLQKIGDVWVMFYFGAFWQDRKGAFNRFACSYDLVNWTDWTGASLVESSEPFDVKYAHKSFVVKDKGIVYHFYCAVDKADYRGIAVATSEDLGKSSVSFPGK